MIFATALTGCAGVVAPPYVRPAPAPTTASSARDGAVGGSTIAPTSSASDTGSASVTLAPERVITDRSGRPPTDALFDPTRGLTVVGRYVATLTEPSTALIIAPPCQLDGEAQGWRVSRIDRRGVVTVPVYVVASTLDSLGRRPVRTISPLAIPELDRWRRRERQHLPRSTTGAPAPGADLQYALFEVPSPGAYVIDRPTARVSASRALDIADCAIEIAGLPAQYTGRLAGMAAAGGTFRSKSDRYIEEADTYSVSAPDDADHAGQRLTGSGHRSPTSRPVSVESPRLDSSEAPEGATYFAPARSRAGIHEPAYVEPPSVTVRERAGPSPANVLAHVDTPAPLLLPPVSRLEQPGQTIVFGHAEAPHGVAPTSVPAAPAAHATLPVASSSMRKAVPRWSPHAAARARVGSLQAATPRRTRRIAVGSPWAASAGPIAPSPTPSAPPASSGAGAVVAARPKAAPARAPVMPPTQNTRTVRAKHNDTTYYRQAGDTSGQLIVFRRQRSTVVALPQQP